MFGKTNHRRSRSAAILIIFALALSACSAVQPISPTTDTSAADASVVASAPVAEATTTSEAQSTTSPSASASAAAGGTSETDPEQIKAGIQKTLDLYAEAYNENNRELLSQVTDQTNRAFKRFIETRFDTYQESIFGGQGGFGYTVREFEPREHGFVEATVQRDDGLINHWTFREVNGSWLMSEPNEKQIGKREKVETEHFTFITYPWASEVNPKVIELMENARQRVVEKLGKEPERKAEVLIKPIFGVGPPESPNALAYYAQASSARAADRMVVSAPHSYVFRFYDEQMGWEKELEDTLTHEYAHLVNNRSFTPISRMSDWMFEGLAEYVADSPRPGEVAAAVQSDNIIPIIDTSGQINKQDLEHLTILEQDVSLAYGLSYEMVAFIVERHGGLDGFWKLVQAYDKAQNLDSALQQAFGISFEQFDREWREWLSEKYGS
jgi:hypothetical protein